MTHRPGAEQMLGKEAVGEVLADTLRYDLRDGESAMDHYAVFDADGDLIAQIGAPAAWPTIRIARPFLSVGSSRGGIVAEVTYSDVLEETALVGCFALAVAALVVFAVRAIPMRALRGMVERLDESQMARSVAEQKMRAHVQELEETREALQLSTERMKMALESAAESSQAKAQFFASMSHELRTPLNAIIGFSEIMSTALFGPIGNERYCDYIDLILKSGRHLLALVNEILDLSKASAGKLELNDGEVDLNLLVRDIIRTMQATADKANVKLISEIAPGIPYLSADPQRLMQVLLNLVSNAIKFNVENGTVKIRAEYQPDDGLKIKVIDTGIGIAQEDIPRALERFGQIEDSWTRRHEGTGLGLPISKKLIELHGGTLMLTSAVGEGCTVTLWFPKERVIEGTRIGSFG
jgi:signal transduction histidine kinase